MGRISLRLSAEERKKVFTYIMPVTTGWPKLLKGVEARILARGHERTVRARKNILFLFFVKGGSIIVNLLIVPVTLSYVLPTEYGLWLTLTSLVGWLAFLDIGLGNGLKNKLTEAVANEDYLKARIYVSTTYAALFMIALVMLGFVYFINPYINWNQILNTSMEGTGSVALLALGMFCAQFVVQTINTVLTANHFPAKAAFIQLVGQTFSLVILAILIEAGVKGSLTELVLLFTGIPLVVQVIFSFWYFSRSFKLFAPGFKFIHLSYARGLLSTGLKFFIVQMGAIALLQTDNIIITQVMGPGEVTTFNIAHKLFSVITMLFIIVVTPFWSAFTEAYVKNDLTWMRTSLHKLYIFWGVVCVATVVLLLTSSFIYEQWIGDAVTIPFSLSLAMAFYVITYAFQTVSVFFLNGIGKINLQLYTVILGALINIPLGTFLGSRYGLAGVASSNTIVFVMMGVVFFIQCRKIIGGTATKIWNR